ncbi:Alt RNA polymerase ADP-ribosylase [Acinetobacter phage Ac42]|uniref:Alt-like RNA polymerase ADP-ribosyltransferase n=1 Tax=Acinetobacter phage Ac42 TaxID=762660 RepID=UPI0001EBCDC3|nr:Alt-like RNA polymerase ADP-ribosyltransferase [Acinetobacter phage Ac42]ADI96439.1 Alt RNA polymerase ADP-ribosylase [Acinetobacter phage Ac42]
MQLNEVFDEDSKGLPYTNLNPNQKPEQTFAIKTPDNASLVVKLASTSELGEKVKPLKVSDKAFQVILFSLSDKGNFAELKNGLGSDPIGAIQAILDIVKSAQRTTKAESIMLRFPLKKIGGKAPQLVRIVSRILQRTMPQFKTLEEINGVSSKHAYVVIYKKSRGLDAKGLPKPSEKRFKAVETKVGETLIDNETGKEVSKAEAVAITIADGSDKKVIDKTEIAKTRIDRSLLVSTLYARVATKLDSYSDEAKEKYNEYLANPLAVEVSQKPDTQIIKTLNEKVSVVDVPNYYLSKQGNEENIEGLTQEQFDQAVEVLAPLIKKVNFSNSLEITLKMIEQIKILKLPPAKEHLLIRGAQYDIRERFRVALANTPELAGQYSKEQISAINTYTDSGFSEMNDFLNGSGKMDQSNVRAYKYNIPNLDNAFASGSVLPKDLVVYRGMDLNEEQVRDMLRTEHFVFNAFVSTSIAPIIFSGGFGNVTKALTDPSPLVPSDNGGVVVGFIIRGLNNVKSIITGSMSAHPRECEIILPRGLMLKIKKHYTSGRHLLVESVIVGQDGQELNESEIEFSFSNLFTESYSVNDYSVLAEYLSLDELSRKFTQ